MLLQDGFRIVGPSSQVIVLEFQSPKPSVLVPLVYLAVGHRWVVSAMPNSRMRTISWRGYMVSVAVGCTQGLLEASDGLLELFERQA